MRFGKNIQLGSDPNPQRQAETAAAVNPANPSNIVAVFMGRVDTTGPSQCFFAYTMNGGNNWNFGGRVPVQKSGNNCFDPSVAADAQGNFYFSYVDIDFTAPPFGETDVLVAKSVDGGKTFPKFSVAVNNIPTDSTSPKPDKDCMAVDVGAASPFQGSIYVAFTDFTVDGDHIAVVVSRDAGATWSAPTPVAVADRHELLGALPVIAANGTAYIFHSEFPDLTMGELAIRFSKSTDGGANWSVPASVASDLPSPGLFLLKNADPQFGTSAISGVQANSFPAAAVAPDGSLYAAWVDFPNGSCTLVTTNISAFACVNADLRLSVSHDEGATWSAPLKVSDDTGASDQFLPWMAAHPDGRVSLVWMDRRLDPGNVNYDAFYSSTVSGLSFLPNLRVSTTSEQLGTIGFVGDYNGVAASATRVFPVWGGARSESADVFVATGELQ
ncbi:MAG: glycoside hydrolase [Acidobacteria bacterium]|nr:glycoside hydrolase [Acidobacteriota bacterium]